MKQFFKQYIPYYKDYIRKFIYAFIGIVLVAGGTSGTAYIMKPLLDDIFINKDQEMLMILPIMVIGLYAAKGFGRYIQAYYISYIGQDIIRKIRDKLFKHILHLDLAFFNAKHGGELISRITNDINRIQSAVSNQIASFIQEILTIVALIAMVIYQSVELAFYGLVVMPIAVYPLTVLAKKMKLLSFKSQEKNSDITAHLSESFNNIEIIKASSAIDLETKRFEKHNQDFFSINIKAVKTNELVSPIMEILGAVAVATVIVIGGQYVIDGDLTPGAFFSFLTALFMLYTPIKRISSLYNQMQDALAANERINELFALQPKIVSGTNTLDSNINRISFNDIGLKFDEKDALKNINLEANKGETIALVGDSGGGKSSLINTLVRFYDSTSGNITIDNQDIKDLSLNSLRDNISIVTQRVYIFNDTIGQNIAYGQDYCEQKVIDALKKAHAFDFVNNLEDGINTILDEFGTNLSGGQRQRIAIARALYKNPQILILDEATSALDNESEAIITEVLQEVSKDKITFVIAHRLSTIKNANKIAVFKNGCVVCQGTQKELLDTCVEYQRLQNIN
ncbi:MAG: ABC transporter ATP-binding protein [Campylobacteraceae bacterium]|jgi:subfamily B ATP-binding cassette protein MsbA|nr:ABC transporter ATP-binding protein [Campylobacteraceae bacterium]MBT6389281.1 ABC transporter ATP-binding protein [Campylobacteraceae bacterium]MBT6578024.1 ABC transporter ATP-binding protein [Campylobacteraceae bacterium]MBT7274272.1 ABC transporter ATP-binding protein [Campylobacteraceae bacterium]